MSTLLLRYHTKTVKYLPMRRSRLRRKRMRNFRRTVSKRSLKRAMRSAYSLIPFTS